MKLKIFPACKDDILDVFNLSNSLVVRQNSLNSKKINWSDHIVWFEKRLNDGDSTLYVVKDEQSNFVGNVKFEKERDSFIVGVQIKEEFRGKGLAKIIIKDATERFLNENNADQVIAFIKKENIASYKSFLKSNYVLQKIVKKNSFDCFEMIYKKEAN